MSVLVYILGTAEPLRLTARDRDRESQTEREREREQRRERGRESAIYTQICRYIEYVSFTVFSICGDGKMI